ncbi:hypothetical protein [Streptomyces europaeiscabiei]|uniref:hypothetical protein n=1 Tax=Streptomyces europaeiscabiei TaxID=146819 RepID=UPI0029A161C5|nr:hypothetical protein [Streptomyces europaeiscabiei]MDX2765061.1 hypothetical protein [Streptomyces europaeiscabiei]MDX3848356.1 hypothetical protein [Streptomyces europaeiscabiei]MDX3861035.1 hypothetical protein [Streptomyces europaeiscabiei]MDX3873581.1 hypothetical protein [Streptomyces europaeiscabiei]
MDRRRVTQLLSSKWGRLHTACMLLAAVMWSWSVVWTFGSTDRDDSGAGHLSTAAVAMCLVALVFLGLHGQHLRQRRGEAEALDVRRVLDHLRSLPTSANGKVALVFAALGVAGWAYAWVFVRLLGWDMPLVPPGDDGGLFVTAGTLGCATAGLFAGTHFEERR